MSRQEIKCPHKMPVSQCSEHYAELKSMSNNTDKLVDGELRGGLHHALGDCLLGCTGTPHEVGSLDDIEAEYFEQAVAFVHQQQQKARIDEIQGWLVGVAGRYPLLADAIPRRIKELERLEKESNDSEGK